LSAPVILAAGVLKIPDLTGPLSAGIKGPILFGSLLSGVSAFFALRFLVRYFSDPKRTLTPFRSTAWPRARAASSTWPSGKPWEFGAVGGARDFGGPRAGTL